MSTRCRAGQTGDVVFDGPHSFLFTHTNQDIGSRVAHLASYLSDLSKAKGVPGACAREAVETAVEMLQKKNAASLAQQDSLVMAALSGECGEHAEGAEYGGDWMGEFYGWDPVRGRAVCLWRHGWQEAGQTQEEGTSMEDTVLESVVEKHKWMLASFGCAAAILNVRGVLPSPVS